MTTKLGKSRSEQSDIKNFGNFLKLNETFFFQKIKDFKINIYFINT